MWKVIVLLYHTCGPKILKKVVQKCIVYLSSLVTENKMAPRYAISKFIVLYHWNVQWNFPPRLLILSYCLRVLLPSPHVCRHTRCFYSPMYLSGLYYELPFCEHESLSLKTYSISLLPSNVRNSLQTWKLNFISLISKTFMFSSQDVAVPWDVYDNLCVHNCIFMLPTAWINSMFELCFLGSEWSYFQGIRVGVCNINRDEIIHNSP